MHPKSASILLLLAGLMINAQAAVVTFTDRAAFIAAAGGSLSLEEFDDLTLASGLTLSTGGGYNTIYSGYSSCPAGVVSPCLGLIETASATFAFSPGVRAVGFDYNELNVASLGVTDSSGNIFNAALTMNVNVAGNLVPKFFGVVSDSDLNWVTVGSGNHAGGSVYFIDDLRFVGTAAAIPAPGPVALVGLGLAALGWRRRESCA